MNTNYTTQEAANEVLEHYENYLLKCEYIIYIAVVAKYSSDKNLHLGYDLQIGIRKSGKAIIEANSNDKLSDLDIYLGNFGNDNTIPTSFPIPSDFKYQIHNYLLCANDFNKELKNSDGIRYDKINNYSKVNTKIKYLDDWSELASINKSSSTNFSSSKFQKANQSYRIKNIDDIDATLGAVFKILEFPHSLFGITNEHLFNYKEAKLGDPIFNENNQEIGQLFWKSNDFFRDAALIKMNSNFKYEKQQKQLIISQPEIGLDTTHNGLGDYNDNGEAKIISINTTVRKKKQSDPEVYVVYRKQLLISRNTERGDSGSLVLSLDGTKVFGLNFSKTQYPNLLGTEEHISYSVANNINAIINHKFKDKQEIYHKNISSSVVTTLVNEFRVENFKI